MLPAEHVASRIVVVRGQEVMLDADLAELYAVPTGALIQAVKRNPQRFSAGLYVSTDGTGG